MCKRIHTFLLVFLCYFSGKCQQTVDKVETVTQNGTAMHIFNISLSKSAIVLKQPFLLYRRCCLWENRMSSCYGHCLRTDCFQQNATSDPCKGVIFNCFVRLDWSTYGETRLWNSHGQLCNRQKVCLEGNGNVLLIKKYSRQTHFYNTSSPIWSF